MPAVWHRRLLESPCIVSGSISKQIKERKGGDAVSASSTPNDAELRREIGPFENSIYSGMSPCLTDYIPIPVRSNAVHLTRPRRRKCSTMLPLHRLRFSPCGRIKCIHTDATRVFQQSPGSPSFSNPHLYTTTNMDRVIHNSTFTQLNPTINLHTSAQRAY